MSALRYSKDGALLASGSQDSDVVVWDVAGETGLFRLRGHLDQVTDVVSHAYPVGNFCRNLENKIFHVKL